MRLADKMGMSSRPGMIAYGVVAGVVWLVWVAATFLGERRRSRALAAKGAPPGYSEGMREGDGMRGHEAHGVYAPKENGT